MKNNQTALEWLEDKLIGNPHSEEDFKHNIMIWGQAKEIEKEQIKDAWLYGQTNGATICTPNDYEPEEQYYNETYKQQDNGK
jgi:hypothetical protein